MEFNTSLFRDILVKRAKVDDYYLYRIEILDVNTTQKNVTTSLANLTRLIILLLTREFKFEIKNSQDNTSQESNTQDNTSQDNTKQNAENVSFMINEIDLTNAFEINFKSKESISTAKIRNFIIDSIKTNQKK